MSAAEKRYFKRHFSSDKSLQTKLFDFINSMDEYEEEQVKEYFSDSNLAKNLKVYKVQLFDLLMKSLTSYHSKRNINSRIRIGLEEIEILHTRNVVDYQGDGWDGGDPCFGFYGESDKCKADVEVKETITM